MEHVLFRILPGASQKNLEKRPIYWKEGPPAPPPHVLQLTKKIIKMKK
jgi:hypothetical protein